MSALSAAEEPARATLDAAQKASAAAGAGAGAADEAAATLKAARRAEVVLKVAAAREALATAAAPAPAKHLLPPEPGERFVFVYLPCGAGLGPQERSLPADGGLEHDTLSKALRDPT
jgi:hypothetical protein